MSSTRTNPADPSLDDSFALAGYLEIYAGDYMETAVRQATAELEGLLTPERYLSPGCAKRFAQRARSSAYTHTPPFAFRRQIEAISMALSLLFLLRRR